MSGIVIDSSYALACVMPDEARPPSAAAVFEQALLAPFIWPLEIASAVRNGIRRGRLDPQRAAALARHTADLDARIVAPWHDDAARYLELSLLYQLTPYDAIYLDLCMARRCELATCDEALAAVAQRLGLVTHT
jgi:predicted nucleic acid-binding protein